MIKTYAITLKPQSAFGTSLKGDTILGHFCWQAVQDKSLLKNSFDHWIDLYLEKPFALFSSAFPQIITANKTTFCLPRPAMPSQFSSTTSRKERVEQRKKEKKKKWFLLAQDNFADDIQSCETVNDNDLFDLYFSSLPANGQRALRNVPVNQHSPVITATQAHNSINRLTMTTGKGFDPFSSDNFHYLPGLELVVFAGIEDDALDVERLKTGMERIGQFGFGRDASIGLGRFEVGNIIELPWPELQKGQGCYTLSPCVPQSEMFAEQFAIPFTRFGRHGGHLVLTGNPFKNPIIMADEGAVFFPHPDQFPKQFYVGQGLSGLSLAEPRTVAQGYSLFLPMSRRSS
jgi:CRISPR-associated protein Csm4